MGLSRQVVSPGISVVGPWLLGTRELVNLDEGQGVYPLAAPLDAGKDLLPARSLLLGVDIDYKVPISLSRDSATMGLEDL